tara:strand:+ start:634 stop:990 length:357 start_codon:yes stop_codon:yes gene_type:complete
MPFFRFLSFFVSLILIINCSNQENKIEESSFNPKNDYLILEDKNNLKDGLKNGEWISRFPNGEIQSVCHFKQGVPDGPIIVYNENGQELYRGNFEKGIKIGEWVFTNPETNEIIKKNY